MAAAQQVLLALNAGTVLPNSDALLREDAFYVLREDGGLVLLEIAASPDMLIREDGGYVLREDDGRIPLEGTPAPDTGDAILDVTDDPITDTDGEFILEV